MIGLSSLVFRPTPVLPKLNRKRGLLVIAKIDEILSWEARVEHGRDSKFVELGKYLYEVRAGQYWQLESLSSFDDFLQRRFPESRRKAYYLMSIHEHLPKQIKKDLHEIGWSKAAELVKVARSQTRRFDHNEWLHNARTMPKEQFKHAVTTYLDGKDSEPSELVYFKIFKSQMPIIEQALETAALMLGSDKSRSFCLEMICADFLAGAHHQDASPETLLSAIVRCYRLLAPAHQHRFLRLIGSGDEDKDGPKLLA